MATFMAKHPRGQAPDQPRERRGATPEGRVLRAVQEALRALPDVWMMRNTTGVTTYEGRRVTYGLCVGGSDLVGLIGGRFAAIEVKAPTGRGCTDAQTQFLDRVRRHGGFACVIRSVTEAIDAVARCRAGASA